MGRRKQEARLRALMEDVVNAAAERIIEALRPKQATRRMSQGNGLHGPKTRTMQNQRAVFESFLCHHPVTGQFSRITRAHQCWLVHPDWTHMTTAKGEARGYSSHKALAAAR